MPLRFRMLATVPRARLCPRFDSAPTSRVYPQPRFSTAICTTSDSISPSVRGDRDHGWRSHRTSGRSASGATLAAVSGVTIVESCDRARRPSPFALAASRRRWSSVKRIRRLRIVRAGHDSPRADSRLPVAAVGSSSPRWRSARTGRDREHPRFKPIMRHHQPVVMCIVFNAFEFVDSTRAPSGQHLSASA